MSKKIATTAIQLNGYTPFPRRVPTAASACPIIPNFRDIRSLDIHASPVSPAPPWLDAYREISPKSVFLCIIMVAFLLMLAWLETDLVSGRWTGSGVFTSLAAVWNDHPAIL